MEPPQAEPEQEHRRHTRQARKNLALGLQPQDCNPVEGRWGNTLIEGSESDTLAADTREVASEAEHAALAQAAEAVTAQHTRASQRTILFPRSARAVH